LLSSNIRTEKASCYCLTFIEQWLRKVCSHIYK
jgi:hypothetical protein